jgi:hypothetical protein
MALLFQTLQDQHAAKRDQEQESSGNNLRPRRAMLANHRHLGEVFELLRTGGQLALKLGGAACDFVGLVAGQKFAVALGWILGNPSAECFFEAV